MMADGTGMAWKAGKTTACLALDEAIAQLEARALVPGAEVDLGSGQLARLGEGENPDAFLERLKGHRLICALINSGAQAAPVTRGEIHVEPDAKLLLDAVRKTR